MKKIGIIFVFWLGLALVYKAIRPDRALALRYSEQSFNMSTEQKSDKATDILEKAIALIYLGEEGRVQSIIDSAFVWHESVQSYKNLGRAYMNAGNFPEGLRYLDMAVEIEGDLARGTRGNYLMSDMQDYERAVVDLKAFEKHDPGPSFYGPSNIQILIGQCYLSLNQYDQSIKAFDQYFKDLEIIGKEKYDVYAYFYRGIAQHRGGNYGAALADLNSFTEKYVEGPEAYFERAKIYYDLKDLDKACAEIDLAEKYARKGYLRGFIHFDLPEEVHLNDILELKSSICSK